MVLPIIEKMSCKGNLYGLALKILNMFWQIHWECQDFGLKDLNIIMFYPIVTFNLYFNDVRNFGTLKLINKTELEKA